VHLLEWPEIGDVSVDDGRWQTLRELRAQVTETIEPLRREKIIGSSLEAVVTVPELLATPDQLAELFIVSSVTRGDELRVTKTEKHKCGRCWRLLPEVGSDGGLCARCEEVVNG
jgi:isoleucyl-tRNA synthetase